MRKLLLLHLTLIFSTFAALAQIKTVTARISDQQGQSVSFLTVHAKGSKQTVSADAEGIFSLKAKLGDILFITSTAVVQVFTEVTLVSTASPRRFSFSHVT
jgi:hypothetical protein